MTDQLTDVVLGEDMEFHQVKTVYTEPQAAEYDNQDPSTLKVLADLVLIKREPPKVKQGLIHVPESAQKPKDVHQGVIVNLGPGVVKTCKRCSGSGHVNVLNDDLLDNMLCATCLGKGQIQIKPYVKIGQRVLFSAWSGTNVSEYQRFSFGSDEYVIMKENQLLGVIE